VIAFGCSITDPEQYDRFAGPGIELAKEPDSLVFPHNVAGSIFRSYNLLLDRAAKVEDLDALVLVHQDTEIADPAFCAKLREAMADPDVGVVGAVGSIGARSIAWWEGAVSWGSFVHRYAELGGGDLPAFSWNLDEMPGYSQTGECDTVDGFLMCLSPWVVRNVRFDENLGTQLHGYDLDFCLTVREAGKKVVAADLRAIHNHSLELVNDPQAWMDAHQAVAEKWDGRMDRVGYEGGSWKDRARRAEAEASLTRAQAVSEHLKHEATIKKLQEDFEITVSSISWKLTEPLRRGNQLRRERAAKRRS
jgi:hypothetical protein